MFLSCTKNKLECFHNPIRMFSLVGVADQLHQNYASDLRSILKCIFDMHSDSPLPVKETPAQATASSAVAIPTDPSTSHYRQNLLVSAGERARSTTSKGLFAHHTYGTVSFHDCGSSLTFFCNSFADPPSWIPDEQALLCAACDAPFTFVRRKHHCRNCGKVKLARVNVYSTYGKNKVKVESDSTGKYRFTYPKWIRLLN